MCSSRIASSHATLASAAAASAPAPAPTATLRASAASTGGGGGPMSPSMPASSWGSPPSDSGLASLMVELMATVAGTSSGVVCLAESGGGGGASVLTVGCARTVTCGTSETATPVAWQKPARQPSAYACVRLAARA